MKQKRRNILLGAACALALLFGAAGCETGSSGSGDGNEKVDYWSMETVYAKAQELGYEGTLEEFMATIQGANGKDGVDGTDGKDGKDGVGIKNIYIEDGYLFVELTVGDPINCGKVVGENGSGTQGPVGPEGPEGPEGPAGADGATWLTGETVPANTLGKDGDLYLDVVAYNVYKKTNGTWGIVCNIKGEKGETGEAGSSSGTGTPGEPGEPGENGADGATWLTGAGAPAAADGKDGDLYLDTEKCDVYKKANGAWSIVCNIKGEKGETGENGEPGESGNAGEPGTPGEPGEPGENGADGATWLTGAGAPAAADGKDGDLYLDTEECDVYKKVNGAWGVICNLKGKDATGSTESTAPAACAHENMSEFEVVIEADCDTTGISESVCPDCDYRVYQFTRELGHNHVFFDGHEDTYCQDHIDIYYCTNCFEVASFFDAGVGHSYEEGFCIYCGESENGEAPEEKTQFIVTYFFSDGKKIEESVNEGECAVYGIGYGDQYEENGVAYVFSHWSLSRDGAPYSFGEPIYQDIALYACYTELPQDKERYEINFYENGEFVNNSAVYEGYTVDGLEPKTTEYSDANGITYVFSHWSKWEGGEAYDFSQGVYESFDLYAVYVQKTESEVRYCALTYYYYGGSQSEIVKVGEYAQLYTDLVENYGTVCLEEGIYSFSYWETVYVDGSIGAWDPQYSVMGSANIYMVYVNEKGERLDYESENGGETEEKTVELQYVFPNGEIHCETFIYGQGQPKFFEELVKKNPFFDYEGETYYFSCWKLNSFEYGEEIDPATYDFSEGTEKVFAVYMNEKGVILTGMDGGNGDGGESGNPDWVGSTSQNGNYVEVAWLRMPFAEIGEDYIAHLDSYFFPINQIETPWIADDHIWQENGYIYEFSHWVEYSVWKNGGTEAFDFSTPIQAPTAFVAYYNVSTLINVSFSVNGETQSSESVKKGTAINTDGYGLMLPTYQQDGVTCVFSHWSLKEGGEAVGTYTVEEDTVFYAVYNQVKATEKQVVVTWLSMITENGGLIVTGYDLIESGATVTLPEVEEKEAELYGTVFTFKFWCLFDMNSADGLAEFDPTKGVTQNIQLVAYYAPEGGSGSGDSGDNGLEGVGGKPSWVTDAYAGVTYMKTGFAEIGEIDSLYHFGTYKIIAGMTAEDWTPEKYVYAEQNITYEFSHWVEYSVWKNGESAEFDFGTEVSGWLVLIACYDSRECTEEELGGGIGEKVINIHYSLPNGGYEDEIIKAGEGPARYEDAVVKYKEIEYNGVVYYFQGWSLDGYTGEIIDVSGYKFTESVTLWAVYMSEDGVVLKGMEEEGGDVTEPEACKHESVRTETAEATCTESGYKRVICAECGEIVSESYTEAFGHSFADGQCTVCGEKEATEEKEVCYTYTSKELTLTLYSNNTSYYTELIYTAEGSVINFEGEGKWYMADGKIYAYTDNAEYVFTATESGELIPYEEGGDVSVEGVPEDYAAAFEALMKSKNYSMYQSQGLMVDGKEATEDYYAILTENAIRLEVLSVADGAEQWATLNVYAVVDGKDVCFTWNAETESWESSEEGTVSDLWGMLTFMWEYFLDAGKYVEWNEELNAYYAPEVDASNYDLDTSFLYDFTVRIENGYVASISYGLDAAGETRLFEFTEFGTSNFEIPTVGESGGNESEGGEDVTTPTEAPTEAEWNAAFEALYAARNYTYYQAEDIVYSDGERLFKEYSWSFTENVISRADYQVRTSSDGEATSSESQRYYFNENGVAYLYTLTDGVWEKTETTVTVEKVFSNMQSTVSGFQGAYESVVWDAENGYFFAESFTDTWGTTYNNLIVRIENGYLVELTCELKRETQSGTFVWQFSDFGNVEVRIPVTEEKTEETTEETTEATA